MDIALKLKEFAPVTPKFFALKIATITLLDDGRAVLAPASGAVALIVDENYLKNFAPKVGDWYVASPQGVESLFSSEIFEDPTFGWEPVTKEKA